MQRINRFKVVSYYTENYKEYFSMFILSIGHYDIDHHIIQLPTWSWSKACNYKPTFILECMEKFNKPIVWIDIDTIIYSNLNYFNELIDRNVDVSYYFRRNREVLSGTLFFNNTDKAKEVLLKWKEESKNIYMWDQKNLQNVLHCFDRNKINIEYLPVGYCYFDLLKNELKDDIIHIEHLQASREYNPDHPIFGKNRRVK